MASITAAIDSDLQRVSITLDAWSSDEPVTVYRTVAGVRTPVRGMDPVSPIGGSAFEWDYEAPFGVALSYVAADAGTDVSSASVTLDETRPWLRVPGLPFLDLPVVPDRYPAVERIRPSVVLRPLGRRRPVVLSDVLQSEAGSIGFYASDDDEADRIREVLEQAPVVLLHLPGTRWGARYLSVGRVMEATTTGFAGASGIPFFEIEFLVVDRPEGGVFGDPTNSYQAVLDTFTDYAAVLAAEPTYLDLLAGL